MNTTQSFEGSIGLDSFITPHKHGAAATMRTLPSFNSLQYSEITPNQTLGFDTISKLVSFPSTERKNRVQPRISQVPQEESSELYQERERYLLDLQKWFLPLYFLSRKQQTESVQLQQKIFDLSKQNKVKKVHLKHQKTNIEIIVQKIKKEKAKILKKQKNYFSDLKGQIFDAKNRIYNLENEINDIQAKPVQRKNKEKNRKKHQYFYQPQQQPVFYIVGGYPDAKPQYVQMAQNEMNGRPVSSGTNVTYSNANPFNLVERHFTSSGSQHKKEPSINQMPHARNYTPKNEPGASPFGANFGDMLGQALLKKMGGGGQDEKPMHERTQVLSKGGGQNNQENCDEEKEIIEILEKSEKKSKHSIESSSKQNSGVNLKMTSSKVHVKHAKVEQSRVNIIVEESEVGSKFSIDKRRRPDHLSIKQSVVKLDISEEESQSRSREDSDRSHTRKKSPTVEYSPTFKFSPDTNTNKSELTLHLRKVTEQESDLINSSNKFKDQSKIDGEKHHKQPSGDVKINEVFLDEQNIKQSQAGSINKIRASNLSKKKPNSPKRADRKITDPDDDDDDDLFSINLLAVSKISKEKQLSDRAFGTISEEGEPIKKVRSNILKKSGVDKNLRGTNINDMQKIEEDIREDERQKEQERKRKNSGKYSMILDTKKKSEPDVRKSGASFPVNLP